MMKGIKRYKGRLTLMLKGIEKIALRLPRTKSRKDKFLEKEKRKKELNYRVHQQT